MPLKQMQHVNIRCADVEASRKFYETLGLKAGTRPPFKSRGYWLYLGSDPVVHLVQGQPAAGENRGSGNLDHVAFEGHDIEATRQILHAHGLAFREAVVPRDGVVQIFVKDPDGITLELNFAP